MRYDQIRDAFIRISILGSEEAQMHSYTRRVRDSILPLSVADTLPKAFEEWHFTGHTEDHEEPCETCHLCEQEGLRYHFEISNRLTSHSMMVGSHCMLQFNVAVFEGGRRLTPEEAKKRLDELTNKMRLKHGELALAAQAAGPNTRIKLVELK